jgi:SAM-dependent methyltransferase
MSRPARLSRPHPLIELAGILVLVAAVAFLLYQDFARRSNEEAGRTAFQAIYAQGAWGTNQAGKGSSGLGSTLEFTKIYRVFLQDFLAKHDIRSVVDAGCGDWEFSQAIDWTGIDYLGLDVVPAVIDGNQRSFGSAKVRFAVANIVRDPLPAADLLVVKDVLQHLSHADIARFLAQLPRYRHVLIVNDVHPDSLTAEPQDIQTGGYRPLDSTRLPHSMPGTKVLMWHHAGYTKLVLHLQQPAAARIPAAR